MLRQPLPPVLECLPPKKQNGLALREPASAGLKAGATFNPGDDLLSHAVGPRSAAGPEGLTTVFGIRKFRTSL